MNLILFCEVDINTIHCLGKKTRRGPYASIELRGFIGVK